MNYGIQYLCHLVQMKNDLNRKRRRFYNLMRTRTKYLGQDAKGQYVYAEYAEHKSFTKQYASFMYTQTQQEMKAMTPEMRKARKEINARFVWSDYGAIDRVECGEQKFRAKDIAKLAELYKADEILLGK